jgi:hypothetical protein
VAFGFTGDEQERRFEFLLGEEREESVSAKKNQISFPSSSFDLLERTCHSISTCVIRLGKVLFFYILIILINVSGY